MNNHKVGILMLDTQFPRIIGDAGNPDTYPMDVLIKVVENVSSLDVVNDKPISKEIRQKFIDAAISLEDNGVSAIVSTCGFLYKEQDSIARAVHVPVMVSSLSLYEDIKREIGDQKIAVLTASEADMMSLIHLSTKIQREDVVIIGMENCNTFSQAILQEKSLQSKRLRTDEVGKFIQTKLTELLSVNPEIGAILIECGNLPPYISAIKTVTDLPVYSILDAVAQMLPVVNVPR